MCFMYNDLKPDIMTPLALLLTQGCFSYSGSSGLPYESKGFFPSSGNNIEILLRVALNLQVDILTILLIHEQERSFQSRNCSSMYSVFYNCPYRRPLPSWLFLFLPFWELW